MCKYFCIFVRFFCDFQIFHMAFALFSRYSRAAITTTGPCPNLMTLRTILRAFLDAVKLKYDT